MHSFLYLQEWIFRLSIHEMLDTMNFVSHCRTHLTVSGFDSDWNMPIQCHFWTTFAHVHHDGNISVQIITLNLFVAGILEGSNSWNIPNCSFVVTEFEISHPLNTKFYPLEGTLAIRCMKYCVLLWICDIQKVSNHGGSKYVISARFLVFSGKLMRHTLDPCRKPHSRSMTCDGMWMPITCSKWRCIQSSDHTGIASETRTLCGE